MSHKENAIKIRWVNTNYKGTPTEKCWLISEKREKKKKKSKSKINQNNLKTKWRDLIQDNIIFQKSPEMFCVSIFLKEVLTYLSDFKLTNLYFKTIFLSSYKKILMNLGYFQSNNQKPPAIILSNIKGCTSFLNSTNKMNNNVIKTNCLWRQYILKFCRQFNLFFFDGIVLTDDVL